MVLNINISPKTKAYVEAIGKTLLTVAVGAMAAVVDNALQHPTGGTQTYLEANPQSAAVFVIVQQLIHNVLSRLELAGVQAAAEPLPSP